jgi:anaphase-promoting complex subunit 5
MLERLVSKATDLNLPYLLSLGVQASAKHTALAMAQPSHVFEFLLRSDIVNCQHSQSDLMTVSFAQKAALWHLYGKREMCSMNGQLMLHLNTSDQGVFHNGEAECIALCQLARLQAEQGEYELAFDILNSTKHRFPDSSEHSQIWKLYENRLLFMRAIHQGAWNSAERAVANMASINSLEASYCRCVLLREKGEASSAFDMVQHLVSKCRDKKDQYQEVPELYARLLQLHGDLYCATGNPTLAGQPLLACVTLCRDHHFSYNTALTTLHLAFVQYNLGMPCQCLTLIESVLCDVLTHGTLYDCARAHFLWVKCQVAAASKVDSDAKRKAMLRGVEVMAEVIAWFRKVEAYSRVKVALYYLARLYHELTQITQRNQAAYELKQLDQQHPKHTTMVINVL